MSDINNVNDPFDFLSIAAPTKTERKLLRDLRDQISDEYGLLCFSRNWQNPVQWSHYADRHKGICLGFDIPSEHIRQVNYVQSRPVWPSSLSLNSNASTKEKERIVDQLLYTKYAHWSYEDEYRLFTSKISKELDGFHYVNFNNDLKLVKVLVGACSTLSRADLKSTLGELVNKVEVFKVRPAFKSFSIVRQKDEKQWR